MDDKRPSDKDLQPGQFEYGLRYVHCLRCNAYLPKDYLNNDCNCINKNFCDKALKVKEQIQKLSESK